jgi:carboxyl-terminal processing protease
MPKSDNCGVGEDPWEAPVPKKKKKTVTLKTFIISAIAAILATVMITWSVCGSIYQKQVGALINGGYIGGGTNGTDKPSTTVSFGEKEAIDLLLDMYFFGETDKEMLDVASLKAYLAATGDIYAAYYTEEELKAIDEEGAGRMHGIGVNIINSTVNLGGVEYGVLKVINVMKDSPAQEAGVKSGDLIAYVGIGETREQVASLGYDEALRRLKSEDNPVAEFTVLRPNGDGYDEVEIKTTRREVETDSVYPRIFEMAGTKAGIIQLVNFDLKTPVQFEEAVESLKAQGCEHFVIDVRNNPGGYLLSVAAVLSYFLEEGDVYIRTEDNKGNVVSKAVAPVSSYTGDYAFCNVERADIGKYKDLDVVVLCNENTASAGELFTATFKDYEIGKVLGVKTFGKGSMQTTYSLAMFGLEGAVKFTTNMYYSAKSPSYNGIGISPDIEVVLDAEAAEINVYEYDLRDPKDNQLHKAIEQFK